MTKRVKHSKNYLDKKVCFSLYEFSEFGIINQKYINLHKKWVASNYSYILTPTVDRINKNGDYAFGNIQFLTMHDNIIKDKVLRAVMCIETGIKYSSAHQAGILNHIQDASIGKCCKGIIKKAGGLHWKYI